MNESDFDVIDNVPVPNVFRKLAAYYHQEPAILASLLLMDFCEDPPKNLIIVEPAEQTIKNRLDWGKAS